LLHALAQWCAGCPARRSCRLHGRRISPRPYRGRIDHHRSPQRAADRAPRRGRRPTRAPRAARCPDSRRICRKPRTGSRSQSWCES